MKSRAILSLLGAAAVSLFGLGAFAQVSDQAKTPDNCEAAMAEPATPATGGADGTAPGNAGNTGWSGGTGGSLIGTNPQGATENSFTWQPPTARGLDLAGQPETAPVPSC